MRIGLPRALLYYNFRPALEKLLTVNGAEVLVSSATNKLKLEQGLALCEDEVCLPVKVMMGHIQCLLEQNIDALFIPRVVSLERKRYICPKFLGLPDMVRSKFGSVPVVSPTVNLSWGKLRLWRRPGAGTLIRTPAFWRAWAGPPGFRWSINASWPAPWLCPAWASGSPFWAIP